MSRLVDALKRIPLAIFGPPRPGSSYDREIRTEKIRAGLGYWGDKVRFLPYVDSVVKETTAMRTAYRQMISEPNIKAAFQTKVLSVAALDLKATPASDSPRDKIVSDFVKFCFDKVSGATHKLAWSILSGGLIDGYSICEKVWCIEPRGKWAGKYRPKQIKAKDTEHLELVGDRFRNVTGVLDQLDRTEYHPSNFLIFSHLPLFEVPTGHSDFRAAYAAHWKIDTAWKLRMIGLDRFTLPMLVGKYENDTDKPSLDTALKNARGQNWISLPSTAQIEAMEMATRSQPDFDAAITRLREDIFIGITGALLQSLTSEAGSQRGASSVHKSTTELLQWWLATCLADIYNEQLVPDLVSLNYQDADCPSVSLGAINTADLIQELALDEGLQRLGMQLSKKEAYLRYSRAMPSSPDDTLTPAPPASTGFAPAGGPAAPTPFRGR